MTTETSHECSECGLHFYYAPNLHECASKGRQDNPRTTWAEECVAKVMAPRNNQPERNSTTITVSDVSPAQRDQIGKALMANGHHHTSSLPGNDAHFDVAPSHTASAIAVIGRVLR